MFYRLIALTIGLIAPGVAFAEPYHLSDSDWDCTGFLYCTGRGSIPPDDIVALISLKIISAVSLFIGALAIVVFLYGALRMVISQGQEGKEAGKKALIWASLGLTAALLTRLIMEYVVSLVYAIR